MRFTRFEAIALIAVLQVLIPAALLVWAWKGNYKGIIDWSIRTFVLVAYVVFIYLVGSWAFASFYLRYAVCLAALATLTRSVFFLKDLPPWGSGALFWVRNGVLSLVSVALVFLVVGAIRSYFFKEDAVRLAFPLKHGVYAVFEGGNGQRSSLMNYHFGSSTHGSSGVNRSMKYAVDVTRLSRWGNDANGVFPQACERYPVFNELVYSPCDGEVREVSDEWPNETPWGGKGPYNLGNHVLIESGDVYVLVGHLQKGSIVVTAGSRVRAGDPIAKVGNSGWTSQPHVHIQAMKISPDSYWKGEGLPIMFDGRNPVKNALFFK